MRRIVLKKQLPDGLLRQSTDMLSALFGKHIQCSLPGDNNAGGCLFSTKKFIDETNNHPFALPPLREKLSVLAVNHYVVVLKYSHSTDLGI